MLPTKGVTWAILVLIGAQLIAGAAVGAVWLAWAPRTFAYVEAGAAGRKILIPDETESQIAGDGRYLVLCAAVGLIAGIEAWQLRRLRGPLGLLSLTAGALLGALVARLVGGAFATGQTTGAVNTVIRTPLTLHSNALLACQALVASVLYLLCAGLSSDQNLGVGPDEPGAGQAEPSISPASSAT